MKSKILAAVAAVALATAASAGATTWNAVADFANANPNGVWGYGYSNTVSSFTAYDVNGACQPGLACWSSSAWNYSLVPAVISVGGSTQTYFTVTQTPDVLNVHPGANSQARNGGDDLDSIVRFTAPTSGNYRYSGFFRLLDWAQPNTVNVHAGTFSAALSGGFGATAPFSGSVFLNSGDSLDFRVNRAGDYYYDSTGLSATVSVPEPATWAMMIGGFGAAGAMLRRRARLARA